MPKMEMKVLVQSLVTILYKSSVLMKISALFAEFPPLSPYFNKNLKFSLNFLGGMFINFDKSSRGYVYSRGYAYSVLQSRFLQFCQNEKSIQYVKEKSAHQNYKYIYHNFGRQVLSLFKKTIAIALSAGSLKTRQGSNCEF